jgi:hypothetical protein
MADKIHSTLIKKGVIYKYGGKKLLRVPQKYKGEFVVPDGVVIIGKWAFEGCRNITRIVCSDTVTKIESSAFEECFNLKSVVLPKNLKKIESCTFEECEALESINIPKGLEEIEGSPFSCTRIKEFIVDKDNKSFTTENGFLYTQNYETLLYAPPMETEVYTIRAGVREIGRSAFCERKGIKKIVIPQGVKKIGELAFYNCDFDEVVIPDTVEYIGEAAFKDCKNLKEIKLPAALKTIGASAFDYCRRIKEINFPEGLEVIDGASFALTGIREVFIPKTVKKFVNPFGGSPISKITIDPQNERYYTDGTNVFDRIENSLVAYYSKERIYKIPENIKTVETQAFLYCDNLEEICIPKTVENLKPLWNCCHNLHKFNMQDGCLAELYGNRMEVKDIGYKSIGKDICDNSPTTDFTEITLKTFKDGITQKTVVISDRVTEIPDNAFKNCMYINNIILPKGLKKIGAHAFENCRQLTEIIIPDSVTEIGKGAFTNCSKLLKIELPTGVAKILNNTFEGCDRLKTLIIPDSVTKIEDDAFKYCKQLTDITIPDSVTEISQSTLGFLQWVKRLKEEHKQLAESVSSFV